MVRIGRLSALVLGSFLFAGSGCVGSGGGGGTGVVAPAAIASGGAVGSNCPGEDTIACAPGFGEKVRCKGGTWISDGVCAAGSTCVETQKGTAVTATTCGYPTFGDSARALACMKTAQCGLDSGWPSCARYGANAQLTLANIAKFGAAYQVASIADDAMSSTTIACLQTAATCTAVANCVSGGLGPCKPGEVAGCQGSVGWECGTEGVRWSLDCATLGLQCLPFGKDALCGAPATGCQPGMTGVLCKGDDSNVCVSEGGVSVGFVVHCGAAGMTCGPGSKVDDDLDACVPKTSVPCDAATFVERCDGNKRVRCKKGAEISFDCALQGSVCKVTTDTGSGAYAMCSSGGMECSGEPLCDGDTVTFCTNSGRQSLDCSKFSLKCGYSDKAYDYACLMP